MTELHVGDKVRKTIGFPFTGEIVADFDTSAGKRRFVIDNGAGMLHVHNPEHVTLNHPEYQYLDLLKECLERGSYREGRNGGTYGLFGRQIRFNLADGFPLLTTKKMHTKSIIGELIWFISGSTNTKYLKDNGISIWNEWEDVNGDLGPVYGKQWRQWDHYSWDGAGRGYSNKPVDQLANVIEGLKTDPYGRRHVVSAWNPGDPDRMALPPCHCLFQFFVDDGKLSCQLYQRSADIFLGVPFNIAPYALLTQMIAKEVGLDLGEFVHTFGDVHLYANHREQAKEQLTRKPYLFPFVVLTEEKSIFDYEISDISIYEYESHPAIKAEVSA